jgi:hypothetical protein
MSPSARTIVELNIQHLREQLRDQSNSEKRAIIARLLAEEEAKLVKFPASRPVFALSAAVTASRKLAAKAATSAARSEHHIIDPKLDSYRLKVK